jgi:hypothetical protein
MQFPSERDAKQFLVDKIAQEAICQGTPLPDVERRLLMFSEQDPGSEKGIPDDVLFDTDLDWEARMAGMLRLAYEKDKDNPDERQKYADAMLTLKDSDHYILVMANQVFSKRGREKAASGSLRDQVLLFVAGVVVAAALVALAMWKSR